MRTVTVTGASGFVGSNVVKFLQSSPDIRIIATGRDEAKLRRLGTEYVVLDLNDENADCFRRLGCPDILIHLAWEGLPQYKSLHHFESELPKQYTFLKTMITAGLPTLLVAGTCFEYGMQSGALSENIIPTPNTPYGFAKNALLRQLEFLQTITPFNLIWARLFYMYGAGQPDSSLYSQLVNAVRQGAGTFNMSGGEQLRDYLPIGDVARHISLLALSAGNAGIVNVCSGKPISVRRLVEHWLNEHDWRMELNAGYYPYPDHEPMAFWGDASKLSDSIRTFSPKNQLSGRN